MNRTLKTKTSYRAIAMLLLAVFTFVSLAGIAPAICCLVEAEEQKVESACCCPDEEQPREEPEKESCPDKENCLKSCCSFTSADHNVPVPARILIEEPPAAPRTVVQCESLDLCELSVFPFASIGPPLGVSKALLHLLLNVILC